MRSRARKIGGYTCTPYLHDYDSVELKEAWTKSENVSDMYFVTATFSSYGKLYFDDLANHYILAKVRDCGAAGNSVEGRKTENASFVFEIDENLFERETEGKNNFVSICYTEYMDTVNAITEIAHVISRRNRVANASHGSMRYYAASAPRLEIPFSDNIMVFEVAGERGQSGHQGMHKYCEQMMRDVTRRGVTLTSLVGLSILDRLK